MSIQLVPLVYIDAVFPKVAHWLEKALGKHSGLTVPRLLSMCSAREAFLFLDDENNPRNAMVVQFAPRGGEQALIVLAMGGEGGQNWPKIFEGVVQFAKTYGAKSVQFEGRTGWQRVMPKAKVIRQIYRFDTGE